MAIYEYECGACGHHFEEWQKMSDAPIKTCPKCGKDEVQRLISATAFHLKGGGWYSDLYSSTKKGGGGGEKSSGGGEAKSDSKSESKSEAKSETKPAPKPTT
jgi:putative FmdB family regulatory protein